MRITNKNGLPKQFEQVAQDFYKYKDKQYSATAIMGSVRELMLKKRHHDEIEQDVSDMIYALVGTGLHAVLEGYKEGDNELKEDYLKIQLDNGYTLSGRFDLYSESEKMITDYKTCSVWSVIYQKDKEKWRIQLLIYSWLLRKTGFEVSKAQIIALMRDWQKSKAKFDQSYPQMQVQVFSFVFTEKDFEEIESYIYERFEAIIQAEKLSDDELPMCTDEERWRDSTKYAVKKKTGKRALRVYDTSEEAERHIEHAVNKDELEIEVREGIDRKCLDYCNACKFCSYYKEVYGDEK